MKSSKATGAGSGDFTEALTTLGFSQYEARCYVGLLGPSAQTGYAVSKTTGVPQPKVYEALRKLVARGAARQLAGEPVRFTAVPPEELLDDLESAFEQRLVQARQSSADLEAPAQPTSQEPVDRLNDRAGVLAVAAAAMQSAVRRIYLSASSSELSSLKNEVLTASDAGVDVVLLCFGRMPFQADGVRIFRHASTDGALFRHHQARHIALVVDSRETVFGLAADGRRWSGIHTDSEPILAAVKGYIHHDIDMQQVYNDFRTELVEAYGPGLQGLESYRAAVTSARSHGGAVARTAKDEANTG
jgi:HTH-type transcriptional regulator, sugar sensing transcriptional regulator